MSELRTKRDVDGQVIDTVACCVKVKVPDSFTPVLDGLFVHARSCVERMLLNRKESSSKYYPQVPSVVSKSLIAKYQRNKKCKKVTNLVLPLAGEKGRQIKLEGGGIRIPASFKKEILPVVWPRPGVGHVRSAEFFKRNGEWFASVCYKKPALPQLKEIAGTLGRGRNAAGNIAVMADAQTGAVQHLGFDPSRRKYAFRHRKANLQRKGETQTLKKQSRRVK